jgi:hypothetical protein
MAKKAKTSKRDEPQEWREASERAGLARGLVAEQFTSELTGREMTGSGDTVMDRLREVVEARRVGDPVALRAAAMELTIASGQWVVALDLRQKT